MADSPTRELVVLGLVLALQLLGRQLLDREHRESVDRQAQQRVDDRHRPPADGAAAEQGHAAHGDALDEQVGPEGEYETDGAHLHALGPVAGNEAVSEE